MPGAARVAAGVALGVAGAALLLLYPFALGGILERAGARDTATAFLALSFVAWAVFARAGLRRGGAGLLPPLASSALLAVAAATDRAAPLRLLPAVVWATIAGVTAGSLRDSGSLAERIVRAAIPDAPDFIRPYCRKLTAAWAAFFALAAAAIAGLALLGSETTWRAFTGVWIYGLVLALTCIEFFVRKATFRYYFRGGPFERLWSRLFPAEQTELGRRSAAYIRAVKERRRARR